MRVQIEDLCFTYPSGQKVLCNLSLSLKSGEFVALLGCNGAGKTTLFKSLLGFLPLQKGRVFIDGKEIEEYQARELAQKIAYIPQSSFSTFNYTVFNTVLMGTTCQLSTFSSPKKEERKQVLEILERLNILHLKDKRVKEISGGERQLTLIARALAQKAKILILDEVATNLDYGNQILLLNMIANLSRQGYTILFATHNPEGALTYADRVILLDKGHIIFSAPPCKLAGSTLLSQIYHTPLHIQEIFMADKLRYVCLPG